MDRPSLRPWLTRLESDVAEVARFVWALAVGTFVWLGGLALGAARGTAFVIGAAAGVAIFLFMRLYGTREPRQP